MAQLDTIQDFILHWGEMGSRWGVSRSVAQMHALLYLADAPLPAETIAERLGLARSNVSTGLRELQGWALIRTAPVPGDRRDHFVAETDPLEMMRRIVEGRRKRELEPTMRRLDELAEAAAAQEGIDATARARIVAMRDTVRRADALYAELAALPARTQAWLLEAGGRLVRLLPKSRRREAQDVTTPEREET